jgi:hypothetical protein
LGISLAVAGVAAAGGGLLIDRISEPGGVEGPAPQTLKKTMWGQLTTADGRSLFPTFRDLGVGIYATQAHWEQIAPTRPANPTDPTDPAYLWPSYLDFAISEAEKYGIKVQFQIIGAPPWANGGHDWHWVPQNPSDLADFSTAIAKRYPDVHLWMIWGEPNRKPNFEPFTPARHPTGPLTGPEAVAPRLYAQLLDASYGALKEANPENLIIGGNTYTSAGMDDINPYQWIEYMRLPDGSRPRMDLWGHNPYGFRKPDLNDPPSRRGSVAFGDLDDLIDALDQAFPDQELKLYLSEWGVPIGKHDEDLTYSLNVEEGTKWIRAGFKIARESDRIYTLGWVHPIDTPYSSQGLLNMNEKPKPSYIAYKRS